MIPEGPLHPDHAAVAIVCAVAVTLTLRTTRWLHIGLSVVALGVVHLRQPGAIASGLFERPEGFADTVLVVVAAVICGWLGRLVLDDPAWVNVAVVAGCLGVWGVAPDTEAALIAGLTAGVGVLGRVTQPQRWVLAPLVLPFFAALVGTAGRPERLGLAVVVGVIGVVVVAAIRMIFGERFRRRRERVV